MLVLDTLKTGLEQDWLGPHPQNAMESGDRFAGAVANWFASAQAGAFPCVTAVARRPQLASTAAMALQSGTAQGAGAMLALAIAQYMAGQAFGSGVAAFPLATSAAVTMLGATFGNLELSKADRAQTIANACAVLAASTLVTFPPPLPPAPVT
jgi:predicted RecA/RadA family phage recombinase